MTEVFLELLVGVLGQVHIPHAAVIAEEGILRRGQLEVWGQRGARQRQTAALRSAAGAHAFFVHAVHGHHDARQLGAVQKHAVVVHLAGIIIVQTADDVTVERVVSAIAHRYGLKPQISEMLMDIEIDHADQTEESDMSFLTRMAEMLGAITTVKSGNLLFIMPGGGVNAQGQPLPSFAITRSSGDRHQFRIADREAYTGVRAYWLDLNYGKKKKVSVKRRKPPKPKKEKSSSREGDYMEGAEGNVFVLRKTYQNEQAARRAAAAKWQQLQRGAASFSITLARGRAELYPEMHGTVTGFKSEIDNQDWIIAKAEHTIDNSGFTTQLELEAKIPEWIVETE